MIIYADTGKAAIEHLDFNLSMIEVLRKIDEVIVAQGHVQSDIAGNTYPGIQLFPLDILPDPRGKLAFFKKLYFEILAIIKVCRFAKSRQAPVVFGYVFPMAQWMVHIAVRWFGIRAALILHGEVGSLSKSGVMSWFGSKPWVLLNLALGRLGWVSFFVLEQRIARNLENRGANIGWVDIPYKFTPESRRQAAGVVAGPLKLVFAGTMSVQRGSDRLLELSRLLKHSIRQGRLSISHVGVVRGVSKEVHDELLDNGVTFVKSGSGGFVSPAEYAAAVKESDYLLILVDPDVYRFICSAVVLDSLRYEVPFMTLRSALMESLFENGHSPGLMFDSMQEMAEMLLQQCADERYVSRDFTGFSELRARHSTESIARQWRSRFFELEV